MSEIYYDQHGNPIQPQQQAPSTMPQQPQTGYNATQNGAPQGPAGYQGAQQQGYTPTVIDPNSIPAHLRAQTGDRPANALDAGAGIGGPRLSIKGKQFRFLENDQERIHPFGQPLHVVIVTADPQTGVAKQYYNKPYQEGVDQSPVCYSSDGQTPDAGSELPQCATCVGCPHNAFGTAIQQDGTLGKGKVCRDFKRVYVIPYDQPTSDVYELHVPPTSFKAMQKYGNDLARSGLVLHGVITTLNFTSDTSPVLTFAFSGYIDEQAYAKINERLTSGELDAVLPSKNKTPAQVGGQALPQQPPVAGITHQPEAQPHVDPAVHNQAPVNQGTAPVAQPQPTPTQPPVAPGVQAQPSAPNAPTPAPCPLGAPAGFKMTEKGQGVRYEAFAADPNWTDQLMIQHGYMVQA